MIPATRVNDEPTLRPTGATSAAVKASGKEAEPVLGPL
jgi:hypothetical protein